MQLQRTPFFQPAESFFIGLFAGHVDQFQIADTEQQLARSCLCAAVIPEEISDVSLEAGFQMSVGFSFLELLQSKHDEDVRHT